MRIVEVLSPSTEDYDRGEKFGYYRACPHVQEYVLIATKYQTIEVYRRTSSRWLYDAYGPGDEIELTFLTHNCRFQHRYLFANIETQACMSLTYGLLHFSRRITASKNEAQITCTFG